MKILMSVVGIGLGHATRSEAIYNHLKKRTKVKILTYGDAYNYFKKIRIPSINFNGYRFKGEFTFNVLLQILDFFKNPTRLGKGYSKFKKCADKFNPKKIFSDSEPLSFFYAVRRKIQNFMLTNLIDTISSHNILPKVVKTKEVAFQITLLKRLLKFMTKRCNKFFVPSFERKLEYRENVEYVDLIVRKKPSEIGNLNYLRKKLKMKKDFYYVHVGGADIERYIFPILEVLLPKFKDKFFVVSSNYATKRIIKKYNMIIYPFIKNGLEYLKISKGIISPAGHSGISEAIVYKKPMFLIPVRNHIEQLVNAAIVKKEGFGEACFFKEKISLKVLERKLNSFFENQDLFEKNLKRVRFKGDGAKEIVSHILKE